QVETNAAARFFNVVAGAEYPIALDGYAGSAGDCQISLSLVPHPENDDFDRRIPLSGSNITVLATTVGATVEGGEPKYHAGFNAERSIWWTWSPPTDGFVSIVAERSHLSVYTGMDL